LLQEALLSKPLVEKNRSNPQWPVEDVHRLARKYWVTPLALMTRLLNLGRTNWQYYSAWRKKWGERGKTRTQKPTNGLL
jgi:hypothetical protein